MKCNAKGAKVAKSSKEAKKMASDETRIRTDEELRTTDPLAGTPSDMSEFRSFDHARTIIELFEGVLNSYGIEVKEGNQLEAMCAEIQDWESKRQRTSVIPQGDYRADLSRALGLLHFAEMIVAAYENGRQLNTLVPHLQLLNDSSIAQNIRFYNDEASNKLFELLLGLACMQFATAVSLDDPVHSRGDNPDVMMRVDGRRWALACKVPNGDSMISAFENIESAVGQIDASDTDLGLVVLNCRNWINHDGAWRIPTGAPIGEPERAVHWAWAAREMPFKFLHAEADRRFQALLADRDEQLAEVFVASEKAVPAVLTFWQTATLIKTRFGPTMSRVGTFVLWPIFPADDLTLGLLTKLNEAMLKTPVIPSLAALLSNTPPPTPQSAGSHPAVQDANARARPS